MSMGGHHSARELSCIWLTPKHVIEALGGPQSFDLDPCAAPEPRPWATARRMNAEADQNGLQMAWDGRIWLNPPYTRGQIDKWLRRMAEHDHGTALIFARTETEAFQRSVWDRASGLLFLEGRLTFHRPDGSLGKGNAGAPSVLCAYGQDDLDRLAQAEIGGAFVPLRFARFVMIEPATSRTWAEEMRAFLDGCDGPVSLADAYRHFRGHPKAKQNPNWEAKVRQQIASEGERVGRATYQMKLF